MSKEQRPGYVVWYEGKRYWFDYGDEHGKVNDPLFQQLTAKKGCETIWVEDIGSVLARYWNPGQKPVKEVDCWELVIKDMAERREFGINKYNKTVSPGIGENWLQHLYEELLDAIVYIKGEIEERGRNGSV